MLDAMALPRTPSQTVGPFFAFALPRPGEQLAVPEGTTGAFWLRGRVIDGAGAAVPEALIETWYAGAPALGRSGTDPGGRYAIHTLKPAAESGSAPYLAVNVLARGLLRHLVTRVYFPDEPDANATDPVLVAIADPEARKTLVATRTDDGYRFDIRLQGDGETVFFEP
jgi:protocatechuate 3,4-dioxygenase alpha subunit